MTTTQGPVLTELTTVRARPATATPKPPPLPADAAAAPAGIDLTALSDDALAALVEQGQAEITRRREKREAEFLAEVAATAKTLGLSPSRVAAAIANKSPRSRPLSENDGRYHVKRLYRDPATGATWSGRGQAPAWIELGSETLPPKKPGEEPRRLPLRKFWISEQEK